MLLLQFTENHERADRVLEDDQSRWVLVHGYSQPRLHLPDHGGELHHGHLHRRQCLHILSPHLQPCQHKYVSSLHMVTKLVKPTLTII